LYSPEVLARLQDARPSQRAEDPCADLAALISELYPPAGNQSSSKSTAENLALEPKVHYSALGEWKFRLAQGCQLICGAITLDHGFAAPLQACWSRCG
jgi:hypothetical protein